MTRYVDGFVLPMPSDTLAVYRRMARKAGTVWMAHAALARTECVADPRLAAMRDPKAMPLDSRRMLWGGFKGRVAY